MSCSPVGGDLTPDGTDHHLAGKLLAAGLTFNEIRHQQALRDRPDTCWGPSRLRSTTLTFNMCLSVPYCRFKLMGYLVLRLKRLLPPVYISSGAKTHPGLITNSFSPHTFNCNAQIACTSMLLAGKATHVHCRNSRT